jgi:hypothetical protein
LEKLNFAIENNPDGLEGDHKDDDNNNNNSNKNNNNDSYSDGWDQ